MSEEKLTIGRVARAAGVGVETIRYYQQRQLIAVPPASGAFRYYPSSAIDRIRFIKRAQELGFTLDEIGELLKLQDGGDREHIREIASIKIAQIENKLQDLQRVRDALAHVLDACVHTAKGQPCPIIETLMQPQSGIKAANL
ncbi:MAG: MerR family DNA-binding protein [Spongiibacteraceae bacterium]